MKFSNLLSTLFLVASARVAVADDEGKPVEIDYEDLLETPTKLWSAQLFPDVDLGSVEIEAGNGVFMAPDGKHALVTTVGATVYAFNAYTGEQVWVYQPEAAGTSIARSHSGVVFGTDYMVYAVVDNENSMNPTTRVVALDMAGNEVWVSDDLEGIAAGCPQISTEGDYVFLTHNAEDLSNGYFTILDGATGLFFYGGSSGEIGDEPTKRYGPIGIFHSPEEGNYDPITSGNPVSEGDFNTNDMLMWSQTPRPTDTAIENGFLYGFQFPRDFIGNASDVSYFQMGSFERDFQSLTAPVITNKGLSAYWGVSRGGFRGWTPKRFSRARTVSVGFSRNEDFPGQPIWAQPALSDDGPEPVVFGGTAAKEFVRMSSDFEDREVVVTGGYVKAKAAVDPDGRAVYYVESDTGILHAADFDTLEDLWTESINFSVNGEITLTPRSDILLVADTRGVISAYQVAEIPTTDMPSDMPSDGPSLAPTVSPTISMAPVVSTETPTMAPIPTEAPVAPVAATEAPVAPPVAAPVSVPQPAPTAPVVSSAASRSVFLASAAFFLAALLL
mmetsp:Transcript_25319/g.54000  ORF Transcript_25319/g.54000 Transcript_25319/m.54000 type:complete len:558 (+) Transcript_25319:111-1784(+)